jgi:hypothetical protein
MRIKAIALKNELDSKPRLRIAIRKEIRIGLVEAPETDAQSVSAGLLGVVQIDMSVDFRDEDGNEAKGISASAQYEMGFDFPKDVGVRDIEPLMPDESYQFNFVAQAHPLAMSHFKGQLNAMGISIPDVPLGPT